MDRTLQPNVCARSLEILVTYVDFLDVFLIFLCMSRFRIDFLKHIHLRKGSQFQGTCTSDHFCCLMHTLFHSFKQFLNNLTAVVTKPLLNESSNRTSSSLMYAHGQRLQYSNCPTLYTSVQRFVIYLIVNGSLLEKTKTDHQLESPINSFHKDH